MPTRTLINDENATLWFNEESRRVHQSLCSALRIEYGESRRAHSVPSRCEHRALLDG